ncbi:BST1 [Candida pseudojiufengensis]|uniref:BST1 n=1 Tax=Candida pseudojiufengensis TaxID=497109 RepID=UPI0022259E1B|nr:BST1 [Candida pseudojiufengensis]KAI5960351.1 BST1 [Candida pseudojiufengensis]
MDSTLIRPRRLSRISNNKISIFSFILGGLIILLTLISYQSKLNGPDKSSCRVVWMYPSYIKLDKFDQTHTQYSLKYGLYLYREQFKDNLPLEENNISTLDLNGIPVLFIPGNAGNYRQVRSIAARTSELFEEFINDYKKDYLIKNYLKDQEDETQLEFKKLDFFTADFNEDFTAFHGRTILDQSEFCNDAIKFILDLYSEQLNPPTKIIIIGHSMGGIVSRIMLTLPNYIENSIESIITLSSPHSASPLTFDDDLNSIYFAIDKFWYQGYNKHQNEKNEFQAIAHKRLKNLSLISITGGALDSTLPADYTSLSYLVPKSNGFTAFTSGIPLVWTPIDHLAIVWCQQLRTRISKSLLDIVNIHRNVKKFQNNDELWLNERMKIFKNYYLTGFEDINDEELEIVDQFDVSASRLEENKIYDITELSSDKFFEFNLNDKNKNYHFSLISSTSNNNYYIEDSNKILKINKFLSTIPNIKTNEISDSSYDGSLQPYYNLELNSKFLKKFNKLYININDPEQDLKFQLTTNQINYQFSGSMFKFLTFGDSITLPSSRPIMININIPNAWNSLYVYKLKLNTPGNDKFLIRQWTNDPYESKWYLDISKENPIYLTMHGIAPFVPHYKSTLNYSMNLQIWSILQESKKSLKISISIDYLSSLKLLILRFRITIIGFIIFIISLIFFLQFNNQHDKFSSSFFQTLIYLNSNWLIYIGGGLILLNYLISVRLVYNFLQFLNPVVLQDFNKFIGSDITTENGEIFNVHLLYLGLTEKFSIIGVLLYLVSNFIIGLTYLILVILGSIINFVLNLIPSWLTTRLATSSNSKSLKLIQILIIIFIVSFIPYYLPYQIVYLLCCILQVYNVLKNWKNKEVSILNYQISILIIMIWILPINFPILIVFLHNLKLNWKTPFSSHHNLLSIIPIVLLTYKNKNFKNIKYLNFNNKIFKVVNDGLILYLAGFSLIYGSRFTFFIHHLFNLYCCFLWVLILYNENIEKDKKKEDIIKVNEFNKLN